MVESATMIVAMPARTSVSMSTATSASKGAYEGNPVDAGPVVVGPREDWPGPLGSGLHLEAHRRVEGDGEGVLGRGHAPNPSAAGSAARLEEPLVQAPPHARAAGIGRDADEVDVALVGPVLGQEADEEPDKSVLVLSDEARAREVLEPQPGDECGSPGRPPRSCPAGSTRSAIRR
jgi:hypothetical protein